MTCFHYEHFLPLFFPHSTTLMVVIFCEHSFLLIHSQSLFDFQLIESERWFKTGSEIMEKKFCGTQQQNTISFFENIFAIFCCFLEFMSFECNDWEIKSSFLLFQPFFSSVRNIRNMKNSLAFLKVESGNFSFEIEFFLYKEKSEIIRAWSSQSFQLELLMNKRENMKKRSKWWMNGLFSLFFVTGEYVNLSYYVDGGIRTVSRRRKITWKFPLSANTSYSQMHKKIVIIPYVVHNFSLKGH